MRKGIWLHELSGLLKIYKFLTPHPTGWTIHGFETRNAFSSKERHLSNTALLGSSVHLKSLEAKRDNVWVTYSWELQNFTSRSRTHSTDPAIAGLRTLLPSMTERFHVLEAGPTRLLLRWNLSLDWCSQVRLRNWLLKYFTVSYRVLCICKRNSFETVVAKTWRISHQFSKSCMHTTLNK